MDTAALQTFLDNMSTGVEGLWNIVDTPFTKVVTEPVLFFFVIVVPAAFIGIGAVRRLFNIN